jgi:hypothetical protein
VRRKVRPPCQSVTGRRRARIEAILIWHFSRWLRERLESRRVAVLCAILLATMVVHQQILRMRSHRLLTEFRLVGMMACPATSSVGRRADQLPLVMAETRSAIGFVQRVGPRHYRLRDARWVDVRWRRKGDATLGVDANDPCEKMRIPRAS